MEGRRFSKLTKNPNRSDLIGLADACASRERSHLGRIYITCEWQRGPTSFVHLSGPRSPSKFPARRRAGKTEFLDSIRIVHYKSGMANR